MATDCPGRSFARIYAPATKSATLRAAANSSAKIPSTCTTSTLSSRLRWEQRRRLRPRQPASRARHTSDCSLRRRPSRAQRPAAKCRRPPTTPPLPVPAGEIPSTEPEVKTHIATAPNPSRTRCSRRQLETLRPHPALLPWAVTAGGGHRSTVPHTRAAQTPPSRGLNCVRRPRICRRMTRGPPTARPPRPPNPIHRPRLRRHTRPTLQVRSNLNKTFLHSRPYLPQNIHSRTARPSRETRTTSSTTVRQDRRL